MSRLARRVLPCLLFACVQGGIARDIPALKFPQLDAMLHRDNDTTYVFNFFATWCAPCRKEFPALQQWSASQAGKKTALIFVSLDFKKDREQALLPFLNKHRVTNDVVLLDETDYNAWINRVDSSWDGNLPMTLVINNRVHLRKSFPQEMTMKDLQQHVSPLIP